MLLFIILKLLFINYLNIVNCVVVDMSTGANLAAGRNWLEIGFTSITDRSWTSIITVGSTYVNPIILIGLPENGGPLYTQGTPLATRIKDVVKSGTVSFKVKLFQPNDSFCAKTWYVPAPITTPISTSWCVVEKGSFNISSPTQWAQFTINTGLVNRTTTAIQVWNFEVPRTCIIGGVPNSQCLFAVPDPVVSYVGAVATLQTLVYDTYLLLRTSRIRRRDLTLVLTPHDSLNSAYFNFPMSETAGFMMFLTGRTISCIEKLAFETRRFAAITSNKFSYKYTWQYARVPGIFGHITTQVSATDSTALRIFGRNLTTTFIITQEDYCDSDDPIHTTEETASILVVGELASVGNVVCGVIYTGPTDAPTFAPSRSPTYAPSTLPSTSPTYLPSSLPTSAPTSSPTYIPSSLPTYVPSSLPTYVPSSSPTSAPSSEPTYVPSSPPTSVPSSGPTTEPTSFPTYVPSSSPTSAPSSSPSSLPTTSPTQAPSTFYYLVRVYVYTSFGDVWDNLKFAVQSSDGSFDYSFANTCNCSNSFAFYVPVNSTFNISIQVIDPTKPVRHSWESFFKYVDPHTGKSYFGQLGSSIEIVNSQVVATTNLLNISKYSDDTGCHRCRHPPPPSKGKDDDNNKNNDNDNNDSKPTPIKHKSNRYLSINLQNESDSNPNPNPGNNKDNRPKRPPLEYPFALFDADGDGWYKEGYDEICPGNPNSLWPSAITYPRYNIISGDRTTVIHQGTICGAFSMEACQEVLPYDGKFVFRVTGYDENPSSVSWNFCGVDGILGQELDFEMVKGKCIPGSKRNTGDFCQGIQSLSIWSGSLLVSSTSTLSSDSITIEDSKALEKAISVVLFNSEVHIESLEVDENELTVYFTSTIILENIGYVGLYSDELEAGEEYLTTSMENAVTNGVVYASIQHIIHSDPTLASGIISHAKSVSLLSFEMTSLSFQTKVSADNGGSSWNPSQGNNNNNNGNNNNQEKSGDENQSIEELTHISYIGYISGVLAVIFVGLLVIVITRNRSNKNSQVNQSNKTLTDESIHPFNSSSHSLIDNSGRQFEQMENSPRTKYVNDEVFRFR